MWRGTGCGLHRKIWKQRALLMMPDNIVRQIIVLIIVFFTQYVQEGVAFKRHKDTLSYFNKNYIHTEIFPRELGRKIVKAEEIRHASDYDAFYIASKDVTFEQICTAERLIELTSDYLKTKV